VTPGRLTAAALVALVLVAALGGWLYLRTQPLAGVSPASSPGQARASPATAPSTTPPPAAARPVVYVHYYLWWTPQHWRDKLGPAYPYSAASAPVPGRVDAQGCNPQVDYPQAQIVDLPAEGLYDQGQPATFDRHLAEAAQAGVAGFLVSWQGTGDAAQGPDSSGYDARLDLLVSRVHAFDRPGGGRFGLGLAFASFGNYTRSAANVVADLEYFASRYGADPAFRNPYSDRPLVMWLDSRKFPEATVRAVSRAVRSRVYLVGDETAQSWPRDATYLDGTSYYWSSENPAKNAQAGTTLVRLAASVHASGKRWFAPFIPGYDNQLAGGSCVPRNGTGTLRQVWSENAVSRPDGWFGISWNELVENTYIQPTRAYGTTYLDALAALIRG